MPVTISPFHISSDWQVHTDLILSLETFTRSHTRFICRSPAGLEGRGDGWGGNRWQPLKYQPPELWVHLWIKPSTGYITARTGSRLVIVNSHNRQRRCQDGGRGPLRKLTEMGPDLLVCTSREVARSNKNDTILCHASVEQPLFETMLHTKTFKLTPK